MKKMYFLVLFIFYSLSLFSQTTFAKMYDMYNRGNELAFNISQFGDNYIIMGVGYKVKDSILYNGYNMFKINKSGELLWKKLGFNGFNPDNALTYYREKDDLYYVLRNEEEYYNTYLTIFHTDEYGDTLDLIRINDLDSVHFGNQGITKIGDYYYLLNGKKSREEDVVLNLRQKIHLIKVDKNGQVVKRKEFGDSNSLHIPWMIYKTLDNNLIFTRVYTVPGDSKKKVAMLCKYDTMFNEIWSTEIGWSRHELSPPYLTVLPDSSYAVSFTIDTFGSWTFISKYNDEGQRMWKRNFIRYYGKYLGDGYDTYREVFNLNTARNGDILVTGWVWALRLNGEYDEGRYCPWVARLDTDGKLKWERFLMKTIDHDYFISRLIYVMENDDGNIMYVGDYIPYYTDSTDFANRQFNFLVQLGSDGCFTPGCDSLTFLGIDFVTGIAEQLAEHSVKSLKLYPNPTGNFTTIDIGKQDKKYNWQIIDLLGYVVNTGRGIGTQKVNVSGLNTGIYYIRTEDIDGEIRLGKLLVNK